MCGQWAARLPVDEGGDGHSNSVKIGAHGISRAIMPPRLAPSRASVLPSGQLTQHQLDCCNCCYVAARRMRASVPPREKKCLHKEQSAQTTGQRASSKCLAATLVTLDTLLAYDMQYTPYSLSTKYAGLLVMKQQKIIKG